MQHVASRPQAEAKYYCVDELVVGTEQSLGKLGVEVRVVELVAE